MSTTSSILWVTLLFSLASATAFSQEAFHAGPLIPDYGRIATIDSDLEIPSDLTLKLAFDVSTGSGGTLNRSFDSVARFLNMHVEAGVSSGRLQPVVVIHGTAAFDILKAKRYDAQSAGKTNPNVGLIAALVANGVEIYLCGQSAAARGIDKSDLLPGVKLALSAMTVHVVLQQQGYSLSPF